MFNTGEAKAQRSLSRYLVSGEKYAVHGFTVTAHVEHASQHTSCTGPAKTKWQRTRSSESDEYITTNSMIVTLISIPLLF